MIPTDATIGNNKAFNCPDDSSMLLTEVVIAVTLVSILLLALSRVEPKSSISAVNMSSSAAVLSRTSFSFMTCSATPPISCVKTVVAADPCEIVPWLNVTMWKTYVPFWTGVKSTKYNPSWRVSNDCEKLTTCSEGRWTWEVLRSSFGSPGIKRPSLVVCTKTLNGLLIAAISGAKTDVFTLRSTGTWINSDVEVNFISIVLDRPFWVVLIASIWYVPYGKFVDVSGHVNNAKLNAPSESTTTCSNIEIVPSGAHNLIIRFSFDSAFP